MEQKTLKDLTLENHKRAERSNFIKRLLNKQLSPEYYYIYLSNLYPCYKILEMKASEHGLFDGMEELKRVKALVHDLSEIETEFDLVEPPSLRASMKYVDYIKTIADDPHRLMAHIYVRHMGDLYGGQMIKRVIPAGSGKYYDFKGDIEELKMKLRSKLDVSMADEANMCFDMIFEMLQDMEGWDGWISGKI